VIGITLPSSGLSQDGSRPRGVSSLSASAGVGGSQKGNLRLQAIFLAMARHSSRPQERARGLALVQACQKELLTAEDMRSQLDARSGRGLRESIAGFPGNMRTQLSQRVVCDSHSVVVVIAASGAQAHAPPCLGR